MSASDSAARTLEVLRRDGWTKLFFNSSMDWPHCILGAAHRAGIRGADEMALGAHLRAVIKTEFPDRPAEITAFNDHSDTTFADVEMVLEKVIGMSRWCWRR